MLGRLRGADGRRRALRGALAGAVAVSAWGLAERPLSRRLGTGYTDVRLLGRVASERHWRPAGAALHALNGALFGAAFALSGSGGTRDGLAWAGAEHLASWPAMALADRVHPDRRSGALPPLLTNRGVFAQETAMHALFGVLLGRLVPAER
jgi:hypothetical protein